MTNHVWLGLPRRTDEALGRTYGARIYGNYNFAPTWDLVISGSGAWDTEDVTDTDLSAYTASIGLNYLIQPDEPYTFYLGGAVGIAHAHAKSGGTTLLSETDPACSAQAGVEWEMSKLTILDASVFAEYVDIDVPNNNGSYGINLSFGFSPVEDLILYAAGGYVFEDEDAIFSLGAIIEL